MVADKQKIQQFFEEIALEHDYCHAIRLHRALGVEKRMNLLNLLIAKGKLTVTEITEYLAVSQPTVSEHLKILKEALLVREVRDGKNIWYGFYNEGLMRGLTDSDHALKLLKDKLK